MPWEATADPEESSKRHARRSRRRVPMARRLCSIPSRAADRSLSKHSVSASTSEASDLNPVAVLITKALVELPPRIRRPPAGPPGRGTAFRGGMDRCPRPGRGCASATALGCATRLASGLATSIPMQCSLTVRGAPVMAWFWARTVRCPNPACGATMPLVSTYTACDQTRQAALARAGGRLRGAKTVHFCVSATPPTSDTIKDGRGSRFRCLVCGEVTAEWIPCWSNDSRHA